MKVVGMYVKLALPYVRVMTNYFMHLSDYFIFHVCICRSFDIVKKKRPTWKVVKMKDSSSTYTQDDIDHMQSEWAEFVGLHVYFA